MGNSLQIRAAIGYREDWVGIHFLHHTIEWIFAPLSRQVKW